MYKPKIYDKNCVQLLYYEKDILEKMYHPFIANAYMIFQDTDYIYVIMDFLGGGDLRFHLFKNKFFSEQEVKFFLACTILGLEYLHKNNLIHHDLKPENLLVDEKGYISIVDFGIAKFYRKNNSDDISGSPGYIAPEILYEENHSFEVDYYSLGVISYELLFGERPYKSVRRRDLKLEIMKKDINLTKTDFMLGGSDEMADFINKLLIKEKEKRLGHNGFEEIKDHPLFKYFNWKDLYLKKMVSPFKPSKYMKDNFNLQYCNAPDRADPKGDERYKEIMKTRAYTQSFEKFKFFNRFALKNNKTKNAFENPHAIYEILEEKEREAFDEEEKVKTKESSRKQKRANSMMNKKTNAYSFTPEVGVQKANLNFRMFSPKPKTMRKEDIYSNNIYNMHPLKNDPDFDFKLDSQFNFDADRNFMLDPTKFNINNNNNVNNRRFNSILNDNKNKEKEVCDSPISPGSIFNKKHKKSYKSNNINTINEDIFGAEENKREVNTPSGQLNYVKPQSSQFNFFSSKFYGKK